jgi:uncharacterized protein YpmS
MSQERLNRLVILSIEQYLLENIEYKSLISNFVVETVCRIIFQYIYIYILYIYIYFKIEDLIFYTAPGLIISRVSPGKICHLA